MLTWPRATPAKFSVIFPIFFHDNSVPHFHFWLLLALVFFNINLVKLYFIQLFFLQLSNFIISDLIFLQRIKVEITMPNFL